MERHHFSTVIGEQPAHHKSEINHLPLPADNVGVRNQLLREIAVKGTKETLITAVGAFIGGILLAKSMGFSSVVYYVLSFYIYSYILIYVHEIGHVLFGRLSGIKTAAVIIGTGRELIRIEIAGVYIVITSGISGGFTLPCDYGCTAVRLRFFILVAGGLVMQMIIAGLLLFWHVNPLSFLVSEYRDPASIFAATNIWIIIVNLIPNFGAQSTSRPNDGRSIVTLPFMSRPQLRTLLASSMTNKGIWYLGNKQYDQAEKVFRQAVADYAEVPTAEFGLSSAQLNQGKIDEAVKTLERYFVHVYGTETETAWLSSLAWAYLVRHDELSLRKAEAVSERAIDKNPEDIEVRGIRACVLISCGRASEGLALIGALPDPRQKKKNTVYTAIVYLFAAYAYYLTSKRIPMLTMLSYLGAYEGEWSKYHERLRDLIFEKTGNFGTSTAQCGSVRGAPAKN
jgi:tetratricopeptide (TPR) repeat protein